MLDLTKDFDRHFYLYAKYHYRRSFNRMADLRVMWAKRCALPIDIVEDEFIVEHLLSMVYKHLDTERKFLELFKYASPDQCWKVGYHTTKLLYNYTEALAHACLSILGDTRVLSDDGIILMQLGEADPDVLPLSDERKRKLKEKKKALEALIDSK
jgi:hypothetical protein